MFTIKLCTASDNNHWGFFLGPIAAIFWHNEEFATGLGRDIALDGVVCVVDAVFGERVLLLSLVSLSRPAHPE